MKILIIGKGYIGQRCSESWNDAVLTDKRVNNVVDVLDLIEEYKPDCILNTAGTVGKPNVDWCETNQLETIKGNTILPIIIAEACQKKNIYLLHIGTGCIFYGDSPSEGGWKEDDYANPVAVYTRTKYAADLVLGTLDNIGVVRIRMPIDNRPTKANLIDKLIKYPKIVDVENSVTIVEDMINTLYQLLEKKGKGIFHVVNPGSIRHKEIIDMYHDIVDSNHANEWITEKELVDLGLAKEKRSNNIMQSSNLEKLGIKMRPIKESLEDTLKKYKENL